MAPTAYGGIVEETQYSFDPVDDFHRFVTRPDIQAPAWYIRRYQHESTLGPGYWFVAFYRQLDQYMTGLKWVGPHIYDSTGELVWSGSGMFGHWNIFDLRVVIGVDGRQHLTLLSDHEHDAYILDDSYQIQKTVPLLISDEGKPNMHAFQVSEHRRTALILNCRPQNVTSVAAKQQIDVDASCLVQYEGFRELDLATEDSAPLFEWNAEDWIDLSETTFMDGDGTAASMCTSPKGWDILHFNSINKCPDGDYLLSARHTDAIYKISRTDGHIVWRLGGSRSDFDFLGRSKFSRQHDAQIASQNDTHIVLTLFDNAIGDGQFAKSTHAYSRGLVLSLDLRSMTAEVVQEFAHPNAHQINARGNFQTLPNGNAFICWAYSSRISEHTPDGRLAMQAVLGVEAHSYRGFKFPWIGRPIDPPDLHAEAVCDDAGQWQTILHVSWNGATEVYEWSFNVVNEEDTDARRIGTKGRTGFETSFVHHGHAARVFAEAFDVGGNSLGRSKTFVTATLTNGCTAHHSIHAESTRLWEALWPKESRFVGVLWLLALACVLCALTPKLFPKAWGRMRRSQWSRSLATHGGIVWKGPRSKGKWR